MADYARGRNELKVGAVAAVALVSFLALFAWLTDRGFSRHRSMLYITLPTAEGLKKGDALLFRGVAVGKVVRIEFAQDGSVVVRATLNRRIPLAGDATAALVPVDIFGRQSLVLQQGRGLPAGIPDGDTLPGAAPRSMTGRMEELGGRVGRLLSDTTITLVHETLAGTAAAAAELQRLIANANATLAAHSMNLGETTRHTARLAANLSRATEGDALGRTLRSFDGAAAGLASTTARMDTASAAIIGLLARLDAGEGTAGKLLRDDGLYHQMHATVTSLDSLLTDVRAHPGRYVTIKVF